MQISFKKHRFIFNASNKIIEEQSEGLVHYLLI